MSPQKRNGFLVLLLFSAGQGQGCQQTCQNAACVQSNFSQCNVECNNTGVSATVGTCQSAVFDQGSTVTCAAGACRSSVISDSLVDCIDDGSCSDSTVLGSAATCKKGSCGGAHLYSSALVCDEGACDNVAYTPCTCCDGSCGPGLQSCTVNTLGFCSSTYLGQTCQEWGNPACDGLTIAPSGKDVTVCDNGDCQGQAFDGTGILCENRNALDTCKQANFSNSLVDCNAGACPDAQFADSTVQCYATVGTGSCDGAVAVRSSVNCQLRNTPLPVEPESVCANVDFFASSVQCAEGACTNAWFFQCSCCDGDGCPFGMTSCTDRPQEFCSTTYIGRTCKEWGNPACVDVVVDDATPDTVVTVCVQGDCSQEAFSDATILCDNMDYFGAETTCQAIDIVNTIVSCESGACQSGKFTDSTVACQKTRGDPSCFGSVATSSTVDCRDESCRSSSFVSSAVFCELYYYTCSEATFDECTCCDGQGCPTGSMSCAGDLTTFCASCGENPMCNGGSDASGGSPLAAPQSSIPASRASPPPVSVSPASIPTATSPTTPPLVDAPTTTGTAAPLNTVTTSPTIAPLQPTVSTVSPGLVTRPVTSPPIVPVTTFPPTVNPSQMISSSPTPRPVSSAPVFAVRLPSDTNETKSIATSTNTPVHIVVSANRNDTVVIVVLPQHGNVTVHANGSVTYQPTPGFVGADVFDVQVCDATRDCEIVSLRVVTASPNKSNDDVFNPLYCLALLALIPVGGACCVCCRKRHVPHASPIKPMEEVIDDASQNGPPTFVVEPRSQVSVSSLRRDDHDDHCVDSSTPREPPVHDVEVGKEIAPADPLAAHTSNHVSIQPERPPRHVRATLQPHGLPEHKDQCRSVAPPVQPMSVPVVTAILLPDSIEQGSLERREVEL